MLANGEPPAILSIHSFTPHWRGRAPWKVGVLWDSDPRLPEPLIRALGAEPDIGPGAVGDNEPDEGGLPGDTINAIATARGLANALIEVRQDLIGQRAAAEAWADRLARIVAPLLAPAAARTPQDWGSRARGARASGRRLDGPRADGHAFARRFLQFAANGMWNAKEATQQAADFFDPVNGGQLRAFVERIERLEEEKKALADDIKDVYAEAKGNGFDAKVIRKVVSIRKQDRDKRLEEETILDLYLAALGMA